MSEEMAGYALDALNQLINIRDKQIATLESEVAALRAENEMYKTAVAHLHSELDTLTAQVEGMREDAERYRWLKTKGPDCNSAFIGTASMSISRGPYIYVEPPSVNRFSGLILRDQADAIIDAARKESSK